MFRWRDCQEGHIIIGLTLTTISWVLLTLTTFSTPYIKSIFFLSLPPTAATANTNTKFGSFGYCTTTREGCTGPQVGYLYEDEGRIGILTEWLTKTLILYGFAALFMLLAWFALILSLLKVGKFMWNPVYFRTAALLGTLSAILAEAFALVLFVQGRRRFNGVGIQAQYGAALWLGLVGTIAAFLAAAIGGPAYQGNYMYRADRRQAYNV
ncbi:uncharacterized protein I303_106303 [Kwoniella dejecticola CBS 10117]|uniref:Uncharacterized protein n=1 Tax=Kwoniella dejecticola CBS 10117 TaxID=1296121 RepID=A0A1A6A1U4_9TREE|nr:uncharacterized protein I303_06323 [Kwoniella dejecticola CBS 10117]OBR84036.1 hypothetical protein I303_06323 [Kwoniella dejecticola CBS 10117]